MMKERLLEALVRAASEFVSRESNYRSLVTITRAEWQEDQKHITIFFSVFPDKDTRAVQEFLARRMSDFVDFVRSRVEVRQVPRLQFLPDPERDIVQ